MQPAPLPDNEAERLAALRQLLLLDTAPEERFNMIVDYAASEFEVPICLMTLLDHERQWFKARVGMDACSTGRDISFCGHAILESDIMVIDDAAADPRFSDNPLVTSAPFIRFYAGAPLVLPNGYAIGTLCLIDSAPRSFGEAELGMLSSMRDMLVREIVRG